MIQVAIVGASGYTGGELLRLLSQHPAVRVVAVTSEQSAGKPVSAVFPSLSRFFPLMFQPLDPYAIAKVADLVFIALPHTTAMDPVAEFIRLQKRVIDLSADYRIRDPQTHQAWYGTAHAHKELLQKSVYGLSELHQDEIRTASLVANPGCYPTGALLGLAPLVSKGLIDLKSVQVDSKSGLSGAGRNPSVTGHFPEANEGLEAYQIGKHRHTPEIEQELSLLAGKEVRILFVPHRIPMNRGILSTIYVTPQKMISQDAMRRLFESFYSDRYFVRILDDGLPNVRYVRGSNFCDIGWVIEERTGRIVIVTAIDNLGKGAAGQAIQNMNLMIGLEESVGLTQPGLCP